jgi:hypothetical protein
MTGAFVARQRLRQLNPSAARQRAREAGASGGGGPDDDDDQADDSDVDPNSIPDNKFLCSKCELALGDDELTNSSKAKKAKGCTTKANGVLECKDCTRTYKRWAREWKTKPKMKGWYQDLCEKKNRKRKRGEYRRYKKVWQKNGKLKGKVVKVTRSTWKTTQKSDMAQFVWETEEMHESRLKCEGTRDPIVIKQLWRADLMNPKLTVSQFWWFEAHQAVQGTRWT